MKNLNLNQMENLNGGICVGTPGNGQNTNCMPCPAFLVVFDGNMGGFGGAPICIA